MQLKHPVSIFLFWLLAFHATAQVDAAKSKCGSYRIEGDYVVFEFDLRAYQKALKGADSLSVDFADLNIAKVAVSGNFNNKTAEGWTMKKVGTYKYRLRKRLKDFKDAPNWQFKFLINGKYWASADSSIRKKGTLGWYDIKNPNAPKAAFSDTGNVVFKLKGFLTTKQVILTGSFNNWDEKAIRMKRTADGWEMHMTLPPGEYEYKFIADGKWMEDPANPVKKHNEYGTYNSVINLNKSVRFFLAGFTTAKEVILAGSFNNWDTHQIKMRRTGPGWTYEMSLGRGKHQYKFIVDGQWIVDPVNPRKESDLHGNENSVLLVH